MGDKVHEALNAGLLPGNASEMLATVRMDGRLPHLPAPGQLVLHTASNQAGDELLGAV